MTDKRFLKNRYIINNSEYINDDISIIDTLYKMGNQPKYQVSMSHSNSICVAFCFNCPFKYDDLILSEGIVVTRINISIHGEKSQINQAKYRMLCAFHRYKGEVLSRDFLVEYVWGAQNKVLNNVNVTISQLRGLLRHSEIEILTIHGQGYLMLSKD
ncbi:winged helix-turn-helix domain-containing protein [Glaciecola punicea]|nr:helix-turn-helix domain-containing protein [Glaciecola punicea]